MDLTWTTDSNRYCSGGDSFYSPWDSYRMLPMLISYFFIKKFKLNIKFGRFSLPLSLRAVKIIKNGFSIVSTRTRNE